MELFAVIVLQCTEKYINAFLLMFSKEVFSILLRYLNQNIRHDIYTVCTCMYLVARLEWFVTSHDVREIEQFQQFKDMDASGHRRNVYIARIIKSIVTHD